ncbi:alpha-L-fucosidase [Dyadobacter sp. CY347]|uniref:alpha-L-fucosidase n=1 Tax=Dyadobacter sp. CY347 TaxID=2909336 RepID=UPI001F17DB82|nr:alpha-L-fucosidase [Dyadobacter sp. CY347]MCF2491100.1 alpha-L-fucosidase [Dyadobacter sp. CY347]
MPIKITTTSSQAKAYLLDRTNSIFPVFVDNMPYESWSLTERFAYFQFAAEGGSSYRWQVIDGALPTGLSLSKDGKLSGTATREGDFNFTVQVSAGKEKATKKLSVTAHPFRAKWHADAKIGAFLNLGVGQFPALEMSTAGIAAFEKRVVNFDAVQWAKQLKDLGFKILNFNAFAGDSVRMWPSTTPTLKEFKTKRNFVMELANACHAQGIKLVVYFAADSIAMDPRDKNGKKISGKSGTNADPPQPSKWGGRNTGLLTELSLMDIDGYWFDVAATDPKLYPKGAIEPDFLRWNTVKPIIRHNNPWQIVGVNPGTAALGNLWQYPFIDFTIFEGRGGSLQESTLVEAVPTLVKKKISVEAVNILDDSWVYVKKEDAPSAHHKPASMIIKNIKQNWNAGATYLLNWPTLPDGTMIATVYKDTLEKISEFVKTNKPLLRTKSALRESGQSLRKSAESAPLKLVKSITTVIKTDILTKEPNSYYRGMVFVVDEFPIELHRIGRKHTGKTSSKQIIIRKFWNNYPILAADWKAGAKVNADGYQYVDIDPIVLDAGMVYYICIHENDVDNYASNDFKSPFRTKNIRILENKILNQNGDVSPVTQDGKGQIINLAYNVLPKPTGDIALGKPVRFQHHLPPFKELRTHVNVQKLYPFNVNDNDPDTVGQPAGDPQYVTVINLEYVRKISKVIVRFSARGYATEMKLTTGITENVFNEIETIKNNNPKEITFLFKPVEAQYVHVWVIKPDGPNQPGGNVSITSLEIY